MGGCASSEVMPLRCLGPIEAMEAERAEVLPQNEVIASVSEVNLQELRAPSAASPCNYEVMSLAKSDCSDLSGRSPSASSTPGSRAGEVRASCREWNRQLRPVALTSPSQTLKVFQSFPVSSTVVDLSWNNIAGCEPLLFEVASFLLQEPEDFSRVMLNTACAWQLRPFLEILWRGMYQQRWPSFYECLACHQAKAWCAMYWQTLRGQIDFPLEIFEREKKLGFSMSVMPARVYYDQHQCAYVATYVSASNVRPESIPISEEHRLAPGTGKSLPYACRISCFAQAQQPRGLRLSRSGLSPRLVRRRHRCRECCEIDIPIRSWRGYRVLRSDSLRSCSGRCSWPVPSGGGTVIWKPCARMRLAHRLGPR